MKRPHWCGAALLAAAALVCLAPTSPALAADNALFTLMPAEAGLDTGSPAAVDARRVRIDPSVLEREAERVILPRFDGPALEAVRESVEFRGPGDLAWRGWVYDGDHKHNVTLTLKNGYVVGLIMSPEGAYELAPLADGGQALVQLNTELYPPCGTEEDASLGAPPADFDAGSAVAPSSAVPSPTPRSATPMEGSTVIDIMVVYTTAAKNATGGTAAIEATSQAAVDTMTTTFINSNVNAMANMVAAVETGYVESGSVFTDRNWLQSNATIRAQRDQFGADVVGMINENGGGFCGVAFLMGNEDPAGFEDFGYQVTWRACAVGNLTFTHEHGHNFGFQHDPANGAPPASAVRTYAYGHNHNASYRTVMSYSNQCPNGCTRVTQWSDPDINFNSLPTGIADARDNVRTGEFTLPFVADWRAGAEEIFSDAFESGNTSAWSTVIP